MPTRATIQTEEPLHPGNPIHPTERHNFHSGLCGFRPENFQQDSEPSRVEKFKPGLQLHELL